MKNFEYIVPRTLRGAVRLLAERGEQARVLAGGTDLIVQMRNRRRQPERVVDVKQVPELNQITYTARKGLRIGAAVPCSQIYRNPEVTARYAGLVDAVAIIGGIQIQGRASLGGNLCNASPSGDSIPALMAYGAVAEITGPEGAREVAVADFCTGPGRSALRPGELLVALRLPTPARNTGAHYLRFIPRNEMDIAVVGAGAFVELGNRGKEFKSARIALGAVAPTPLFASQAGELLAGKPVGDEAIAEAVEAAKAIAKPITDMRGTAEFRLHLVGVLTRRALQGAVKRARGEFVANAVQEAAG
ncbi:MAG: xanthine dehydrogenase family protein subunit M [Candidatus Handelsmanbacteria bacterium]|nr:xanthine dehydrogenase family protein subunit M [Candidatus Handelsmanbacteria bacterium]